MSTLHIIGNGFDLHHGIKSSYANFRDFANKCKDTYWTYELEKCYNEIDPKSGDIKLWCDLERSLPNLDFKGTYDRATEDVEREEGHEIRFIPQMEDSASDYLNNVFGNFHKTFEHWVGSLIISKNMAKNIPYFDDKGIFLSFNYTETLEYLYHIPRERIRYIHGRRNTDDKLVVGHNEFVDYNKYLTCEFQLYETEAYRALADVLNEQRKKISSIFDDNNCSWHSIKGVKKVIVYGHSLNEIDKPYFEEIMENIDAEVMWYFSVFYMDEAGAKQEEEKVEEFCKSLNIPEHSTFRMSQYDDYPTTDFP